VAVRGAVFAAAVLLVSTAAAWADCKAVPSDLDNYGIEQLGATEPTDMNSRAARTEDCNYQTDAVCTYVDRQGVWYSLVEGVLEWKSIRLARLPPNANLPFGLSAGDTAAAIRAKMASRHVVLIAASDPLHKGGSLLSTDLCLLNKKQEAFAVTFQFDAAGQLAGYETRIPSPRD
jgi:hypothetical protein